VADRHFRGCSSPGTGSTVSLSRPRARRSDALRGDLIPKPPLHRYGVDVIALPLPLCRHLTPTGHGATAPTLRLGPLLHQRTGRLGTQSMPTNRTSLPLLFLINFDTRREMYRLLTSAVIPRPIAFVSSLSASGVRNLAPFRCFLFPTQR
jgi:hypothetical protein